MEVCVRHHNSWRENDESDERDGVERGRRDVTRHDIDRSEHSETHGDDDEECEVKRPRRGQGFSVTNHVTIRPCITLNE